MSSARLATFIPGANLYLVVTSLFNNREPLHSRPHWKDDIENTEWLDILLSFTAVKNLYLSKQCSSHIARALQELIGGRTTEVLSALQNVLLEGFQPSGPVEEGIGQFISARQLTNRPVAISVWDRLFSETNGALSSLQYSSFLSPALNR